MQSFALKNSQILGFEDEILVVSPLMTIQFSIENIEFGIIYEIHKAAL